MSQSLKMAKFHTRLILGAADDSDSGQWILEDTLIYESNAAGRMFVIPKGFRTDLASVPRLPIVFWLTGATSNAAAVVHDYLYNSKQVSRAMADAVLREASAVTGVPAWRRWAMWAAVRCFGGSHY